MNHVGYEVGCQADNPNPFNPPSPLLWVSTLDRMWPCSSPEKIPVPISNELITRTVLPTTRRPPTTAMPPRIRSSSCQPQLLLNCLDTAPTCSLTHPPSRALHRLGAAAVPASARPSSLPSPQRSSTGTGSNSSSSRCFSTTPARPASRLRRQFLQWIRDNAERFRQPPKEGGTNYISQLMTISDFEAVAPNQPFPNNPAFRSEPVLSDEARETIWAAVMEKGMPLKAVSAQFNVDMRRVAAVVRMKQIEKKWEKEVSLFSFPFYFCLLFRRFYDELQNKNSISLEDTTPWLENCSALNPKALYPLSSPFPPALEDLC